VEIDLDAIAHNIDQIIKLTGKERKVMGIVKADAYGHGAVEVANVLIEHGVRYLAVAILDEAIALRKAGIKLPILILGYTPGEQSEDIIKWDIMQTIYNKDMAYQLSKEAEKHNKQAKIHIKLDTGMGRIGFRDKNETIEAVKTISQMPFIEIEGIFTHYSVADQKDKEYTISQLEKFEDICEALEDIDIHIPIKHTANSAATIDFEKAHLNLIRPGIILYGLYPSEEVLKERIILKPAMTFKTRIANIKNVSPNSSISYGRKHVTTKKSIIATLPVGYADGYSRMLSGSAEVLVKGIKAPVVGTICMDQCMIDITDIPDVKIGDEVVLFGQGLSIEELAEKLGTINYEIICMVSKRVPRVYMHNGEIKCIKNILLD
jgi:alanine racemase